MGLAPLWPYMNQTLVHGATLTTLTTLGQPGQRTAPCPPLKNAEVEVTQDGCDGGNVGDILGERASNLIPVTFVFVFVKRRKEISVTTSEFNTLTTQCTIQTLAFNTISIS